MNVADSEVIGSILKVAGYEVCDEIKDADLILLNTCSIRDNAEQKIYGRLDQLNAMRRGKETLVGVVGCMAERVKEQLIKDYKVNIVAGPDTYLSLPELIAEAEICRNYITNTPKCKEHYTLPCQAALAYPKYAMSIGKKETLRLLGISFWSFIKAGDITNHNIRYVT